MGRLTVLVLGSAAGGGFPQWNCRCPTCRLAWAGDARARPRTQTSLAVTGDGESWVLINAAPDLPQQVRQSPALHPASGTRGSPIKAVILTGAEIDQAAGLLSLRERESFSLYATAATHAALAGNAMFAALVPDLVLRHVVLPGQHDVPQHQIRYQGCEHGVPGKRGVGGCCGVQAEGFAFSQTEQASRLVDFGAGENDGLDGAAARARSGMQRRRLPYLLGEVGSGVDQDPAFSVTSDGEAGLRAGTRARVARPCQPACRAAAIP